MKTRHEFPPYPRRGCVSLLVAAVATVLGVAAMAWVAIFILTPQAEAATVTMDGKTWLAAQPELTGEMGGAGTWQWIICGQTQPPWNGHCPPGDVAAFGSWWKLKYAITHPAGRTVFWLDQESWAWTPKLERDHPLYYLRLAGQYAHAHHVTLFEAPVITGRFTSITAKRAAQLHADVVAATYATGVDIQDQWAGAYPATYQRYAIQYAKAMRVARRGVIILDNLSTDPGGQVAGGPTATPAQSAAILHHSYENARPYVNGFWFETPTWLSQPPSPANCGNSGCPAVAAAFLTLIGATS